jgi:hypothetical protein
MTVPGASSDRIILFTLVDLLIQIIFFGFLLFAANRAAQGSVQDRVALLARKFGVVSVVRFLDATSKLVAISDLGRVDVVPIGDKSRLIFNDTAGMLERIDRSDVRTLARMDKRQLQTFTKMYAALAPADRRQLSSFVSRYGIAVVRKAVGGGLTPKQLLSVLDSASSLPTGDREKLLTVATTFAKADPAKRQKIVDATANIVKLPCFGGRPAFHITEVSNGYIVQPLIPDVAGLGGSLGEGEFSNFAAAITGAHTTCVIRVLQDTQTNNERQFKNIQRYFWTL